MNLFQGKLVRLAAANGETDAERFASFWQDSEYSRLLDSDPALFADIKDTKHNWAEAPHPEGFLFLIRTLADDQLIGFVWLGLSKGTWPNGDGWLGIGIGDRTYWGHGYGTDALQVALRYGFMELGLHRASLGVFSYNERAIRAYTKVGFQVEGRSRGAITRNGQRFDDVWMGLLREEWEQARREA